MTKTCPGGYVGRKEKDNEGSDSEVINMKWYQISYSLGGRRWFIYKIVRYENLHETIEHVLKIDGVKKIKIEIQLDCEEN